MIAREKHAKAEWWCPEARTLPAVLDGTKAIPLIQPVMPHNRIHPVGQGNVTEAVTHASHNCLGTGCAAWRWWDREGVGNNVGPDRRGYCGKAGRPVGP